MPTDREHREYFAVQLHHVAHTLSQMSTYWYEHDLDGGFLDPDDGTYPFGQDLDELLCEVRAAAERLDFLASESIIVVSGEEYERILRELAEPPKINEALLELIRRSTQ